MAKPKSNLFQDLEQALDSMLVVNEVNIELQDSLEVSGKSAPVTGTARLIGGPSAKGSYSYAMAIKDSTGKNQVFKFFTKELLKDLKLTDVTFGAQKLPDGKQLLWLNS
jgi:hypothetical protein